MPVTKNDVIGAYRWILGREPSENEINIWLNVPSAAELREKFISSHEFLTHNAKRLQVKPRLPIDAPRNSVEWEIPPEQQELLVKRVERTWTALGTDEPFWSVLSAERFRKENIQEHKESFFSSGAADCRRIAEALSRHGITPADLPRVCEFGCGVGRVTPHLASEFQHVTAVDISESHLALARAQVANLSNVRFELARIPEFGLTEPFDLWYSYIVLQHNPPPVIAMVLRRMFSRLAPRGVAIFQVPIYVPGYRFNPAEYLARPESGKIEVHCLPQDSVFALAHEAGCAPLEVREDLAMPFPWISQTFVFRRG